MTKRQARAVHVMRSKGLRHSVDTPRSLVCEAAGHEQPRTQSERGAQGPPQGPCNALKCTHKRTDARARANTHTCARCPANTHIFSGAARSVHCPSLRAALKSAREPSGKAAVPAGPAGLLHEHLYPGPAYMSWFMNASNGNNVGAPRLRAAQVHAATSTPGTRHRYRYI